jgi:hypothetical protein
MGDYSWIETIRSIFIFLIFLAGVLFLIGFVKSMFDVPIAMLERATKDTKTEYDRLVNIEGAEDEELWSCDDILLRIHQLKRLQNRHQNTENPLEVIRSQILVSSNQRNEIEDTIFKLERIAVRRNCHDETPPEIIIGYERE